MIEMKLRQGRKKDEIPVESTIRAQSPSFRTNKETINKNHIDCFKCQLFGHYVNECLDQDKDASAHSEKKEN